MICAGMTLSMLSAAAPADVGHADSDTFTAAEPAQGSLPGEHVLQSAASTRDEELPRGPAPPTPHRALGDDCTQPIPVYIPNDLVPDFVDDNATCGRGDDYDQTCLGTFDGGEDIIYELNVTAAACINLMLEADTAWTAMAIHDSCPLAPTTCLYEVANAANDIELIEVLLEPGTYYLMIDTWSPPDCIGSFTLTITSCFTGACCEPTAAPLGCYITTENECLAAGGFYVGDSTSCSDEDCNGNGVDDLCDVLSGAADDCNSNNIPDVCDALNGTSDDYNANLIPDECEPDCNANGVVDECDVDCSIGNCAEAPNCGLSADCNANLIPDECELAGGAASTLNTTFDANHGSSANMFDLTTKWPVRIYQMDGNFSDPGPIFVEVWYVSDLTSYVGHERNPSAWTLHEIVEVEQTNGPDVPTPVPFSHELVLPKGVTVGILFQLDGGLRYSTGVGGPYESTELYYSGGGLGGGPYPLWEGVQFEPRTWNGTIHYYPGGSDCNENGVLDSCDIPPVCEGSGCSADCQDDRIPDDCQLAGNDCNENLVPDECDIASGFSLDCNADGIPDECELQDNDCQPDGIPDDCQLGVNDCNGNLVPDSCDVADGTSLDINANGIPDECDYDCNANGVLDDCEMDCTVGDCAAAYPELCGTADDCNGNLLPDECELGDPVASGTITYQWDNGTQEATIGVDAGACLLALNHFTVELGGELLDTVSVAWGRVTAGTPATIYVWSDPNQDGQPHDAVVLASVETTTQDVNWEAPAEVNFTTVLLNPPVWIGPPGTSFFVGYGLDSDEYPMAVDADGYTGTPDGWITADTEYGCDPNDIGDPNYNNPVATLASYGWDANLMVRATGRLGGVGDCNSNGIPDDCDTPPICKSPDCSSDCQGDLIPDECQLEGNDCNENGVPDLCDISVYFGGLCGGSQPADRQSCSTDLNQNGVPDECDGLGDMNCDGVVTFDDIAPFVTALSGQQDYENQFPDCNWFNGDIDGSGVVDFDDIYLFVYMLS